MVLELISPNFPPFPVYLKGGVCHALGKEQVLSASQKGVHRFKAEPALWRADEANPWSAAVNNLLDEKSGDAGKAQALLDRNK